MRQGGGSLEVGNRRRLAHTLRRGQGSDWNGGIRVGGQDNGCTRQVTQGREGVISEGECGMGVDMPSEDVSIGEEASEPDRRAAWKAGPLVTMVGMPLAGRAAWRAFQKSSDTTVRAGEAPCEVATAVSISTMVLSMMVGGI
jgi:hypothetical protein